MVGHDIGRDHRSGSFQRIEQQREYSEHRRFAGDIRRPDISAATFPHIFPAEDAH